jgi:hypothetical protein
MVSAQSGHFFVSAEGSNVAWGFASVFGGSTLSTSAAAIKPNTPNKNPIKNHPA